MGHLKKSNKTYFQHMFEAIQGSLVLIVVALVSFVHAIFPFMFPKYVSRVLIKIYYRHFHNHPSPDVQDIIRSEKEISKRKMEIIGIKDVEEYEALSTINAEYQLSSKKDNIVKFTTR